MINEDVAQRSKTALVLAGGGVTGAFYEIGALAALDAMLPGWSVNNFDSYVGTSAGAFVAACLANGLTPQMLLQHVEAPLEDMPPLRSTDLLALDWTNLLLRGLRLPAALAQLATKLVRDGVQVSLLDAINALAVALPSGLYDSAALDRFLSATFARPGMSNDFRALRRDLALIATDLDTGERAVFGVPPLDAVPISRAVAASAALPLVYRPVRIAGRDYIDGGLRGTASLDLAIERGARLIVCINPQVPFDERRAGTGPGHIRRMGAPGIANQTFRTFVHAGLHYHLKQIRRMHPRVDLLLIEPAQDDLYLFSEMSMSYATRLQVAQHACASVTRHLADHAHQYRTLFAHHSIEFRAPPPSPAPAVTNGTPQPDGPRGLRVALSALDRLLDARG